MSLKDAVTKINKDQGAGSIFALGSREALEVPSISTGSIAVDNIIGIGGFPRGRIIEAYGPESSGKTTLCLSAIAEAQKLGGTAALIDAEHALDAEYARAVGVDIDNLLVSQPDYGEQALEIADTLVRSGEVDIIVVDSVAALLPKAELEGEMGGSFMGLHARLMSQALRKLTGVVHKSDTCFVFINQVRDKIGIAYGNPEVTTGGRALKFWASVRLEVRRGEVLKRDDEAYGFRTKVKCIKNKMSAPLRVAEFDLLFGHGISKEGDVLDVAVEKGIVIRSGSYYKFNGESIGQGRASVVDSLTVERELYEKIRGEVLK